MQEHICYYFLKLLISAKKSYTAKLVKKFKHLFYEMLQKVSINNMNLILFKFQLIVLRHY